MASLTLKRTSPYYFACFRDHEGRQCRRSTFETDRRQAQKVADMYEDVARRKINARKIRKTVQELCGDELPCTTLADYCATWLSQKKREVALGTLELYEKAIRKFIAYLGERVSCDLSDICKRDIVSWRDSMATKLSPATANLDLRVVKMIFKSARRDGFIEVDVCEFISMIKQDGDGSSRRPFTLGEIARVLEVAGTEWQSMIKFAIYSGQRLGDIAALTWANIDLQRNELNIVTRKRNKRLTIPIAASLREHILTLPGGDTPDAPVHSKAYGLLARDKRVRSLSAEFGNLLAAAGLRAKLPHVARANGRASRRESLGLSFHCLRHSAVSLLRSAGVSEAVVMSLVGHDSVEVSRNYTHIGTDALSRAVDTLPKL